MEELYIPPCCIDRKLPPVIQSGACAYFYSMGDWGLQKLWNAVSHLVPGQPFTLLAIPALDVYTLRFIKEYFDHGWLGGIALITASDNTDIVKGELSHYIDKVWYAPSLESAQEAQLWIRSSNLTTMVVSGPITHHDKHEGGHKFCSYTSSLTNNTNIAQRAFQPWRSMLRLHATIKGNNEIFDGWLR